MNYRKAKKEWLDILTHARYAHRGFHHKPEIAENSPTAFKRAIEEGFAIELDVHLTLDKKLAIIHDASLKRTAGVDLNIEEITLEEAKKYPLEASDDRIMEFSDFLKLVDGKVPLLIELKAVGKNEAELTDYVMAELKDYQGVYCIESFFPFVIGHLKKNYPHVIRGQLAGRCGGETKLTKTEDYMLTHLTVNLIGHPDFVAYHFEDREVREFRHFRRAKFFWTIKKYEDYKTCKEMGIAPIFEQFNPKDFEAQ